MNSIGNIRISQIPPIETLAAKVLVTFDVFGPILPDTVVQIYASGRSDTIAAADLKEQVELNTTEVSYEKILDLQAGTPFFIHLCPRTVTNGVPDPMIDGQFWETFCTFNIPFTTQAVQPPPPGALRAPIISSIEPHQATLHDEGNIVVRWSARDEFDKYHFMFTDAFPPPTSIAGWSEVEINAPRSHGFSFKIPRTSISTTYTFKVQGCKEFDLGPDKCSDFSPPSAVVMPTNTHSLREFLRLSNVQLNPGVRSLGAPAFSSGIRAMMRL